MAANGVLVYSNVIILILVNVTLGINLGLISGDNKRLGSPLIIKKYSHKSPIFINIKPPFGPILPPLPKLPKPSPLSPLRKLRSPLLSPIKPLKVPIIPKLPLLPPMIPKLPLIPIIPKIPLLPLFPPILPPFPLLPILPPPFLPIIPSLKPLKLPLLKTPLQRALGSELKPVKVPCDDNKHILGKLRELRKGGMLTTAEFTRIKKILLKKK